MSGVTETAINDKGDEAVTEPPIWQRCWCWQLGRCLVDCPTADLPRPVPMTDDNWKQAWMEVTGRRLYALDDDGIGDGCTREHDLTESCWGCHPKTRPLSEEDRRAVEQVLSESENGRSES